MSSTGPLTDGEKKWQLHFERKLDHLGEAESFSTSFLDPRQVELAETSLRRRGDLSYTVFGGYAGAERNAISVFPAQHKEILPDLAVLKVDWSGRDQPPGHRDLLGAVLSLGLRRDQVGDIILFEDGGAAIIIVASKADFVTAQLVQAGSTSVSCSIFDSAHLPFAGNDGREVKGTVASLRADSVISLGFGIPRSRVALLIKGGIVRVNWRAISSPSYKLKEGDQVSLKGKGRLFISAVQGETRKGRIHIRLKKHH